ncbi:hypothetical protein [Hydrogenimonas sp.]
MKKLLKPFLLVALIITLIVALFLSIADKPHPRVVLTGNPDQKAIEIFPDAYQCTQCKMVIRNIPFSAQAAAPDGTTRFFDDIGCLAQWVAESPVAAQSALWVYALDTKRWIDAKKGWYSVTESTPMHYGFGAHERACEGCIRFHELLERMRRGEHLANPAYAKTLKRTR